MASLAVLLFRAVAAVLRADDAHPASLDDWKKAVRARFPEVRQVPSADVAAALAGTNPPVLLDVRPAREFAVSHLPGALRVDPDAKPGAVRALVPDPARPVVVYCSVGWRSSALARRLAASGMTNVANLEGSIFAWATEGRPLEADGKPASRVHPYNRVFGRLLPAGLRADP